MCDMIKQKRIGCAVGMDGAGYFSRMLKKAEGISPREYRKQWQQR